MYNEVWRRYFHISESKLNKQLDVILHILIDNQKIMKCLLCDTDDALSKEDIGHDEILKTIDLIKENPKEQLRVYTVPFSFTHEEGEDEKVKSELRVYYNSFKPKEDSLRKDNFFKFEIIVHKDLWNLEFGNIRALNIMSEIIGLLNASHSNNGLGHVKFSGGELKSFGKDYWGYELECTVGI